MIEARTAAAVRAAEQPLLAAGVPLMERAAFALAGVVARELRARRGRVAGARVALLVGSGNNGGDALFAGALLRRRGVAVDAYLVTDRAHDGGLAALSAAGGRVVSVVAGGTPVGGDLPAADRTAVPPSRPPRGVVGVARDVLTADAVLDAVVGTGATGALRGVGADVVAALASVLASGLPSALPGRPGRPGRPGPTPATDGSRLGATAGPARPLVVAVDVPSGIGTDDGTLPGAVLPADVTVTFGAAKPGLLLPPAAPAVVGRVEVVDIGLGAVAPDPRSVTRLHAGDVAAVWPAPSAADQKYTRGVVGVVAGTAQFPGAAVLAASGAVRAGVGMVRCVGPDPVVRAVVAARPEVVPARGRVQAWVLGPGLPAADPAPEPGGPAHDEGTVPADVTAQRAEVRLALDAAGHAVDPADRVPAVVDAGALSLLPDRLPPSVVLTPHAGELAALLRSRGRAVDRAAVEAEPLRWATLAHDETGATVLLKGAVTVVVGPGEVYAQADGPAWLATAGAGDVLAGVLGALLAGRSRDAVADPGLPAALAAAAASVHGWAATAANPGGPVSALAVADAVPGVVADLLRG